MAECACQRVGVGDDCQCSCHLMRQLGRLGQELNARLAVEERQAELGIRDADEPSRALTDIECALRRAPLTPDELERIRLDAGIDVLADIGLRPDPDVSEVER